MGRKLLSTIPRDPADLERFFLDAIDKLKSTFVTLADVETLIWAIHNDGNPRITEIDIASVTDSSVTTDFFTNSQQTIRDLESRVNDALALISFERNNDQRVRDIEQFVQDNQTLYWMET